MNVLAGYTSESRNIQVDQKASNTNGTHAKSTAKTVFKGLVSDPAALTGKNPPAVTALGAMIAVTVLVTMLLQNDPGCFKNRSELKYKMILTSL